MLHRPTNIDMYRFGLLLLFNVQCFKQFENWTSGFSGKWCTMYHNVVRKILSVYSVRNDYLCPVLLSHMKVVFFSGLMVTYCSMCPTSG